MSRVMVLGAGIYQLPLIEKIKKLGHEAVVVSPKGLYPGIEQADIFVEADTRDREKVLSAAVGFRIDAVLTTGTDVAVPAIGYVVDQLNLRGTGYIAALASTDKTLMKQRLIDNDVKTAAFKIVNDLGELEAAAQGIGFPVIVKAVDSSGSRGITKVDEYTGLARAYNEALKVSNEKHVIVEEYLQGYELGAQAIVIGDKVSDVLLHSDEVTPPPISVPIGHAMPLSIEPELELKIKELVIKAVSALGIMDTISNVDIMVVDGEPYLLEIGARMGATCIPENISIFIGGDIYEFLISLALGHEPELPRGDFEQPNAAIILRSDQTGKVKRIQLPENIYEHPNLVEFRVDVAEGDQVKRFTVGPDRIGQVIVKAETAEEAISLTKYFESMLKIEFE